MCGICGILKPRGELVDERVLESMRDSMRHRGPDGAGLYAAGSIGLGHRRLKIIDLSEDGAQPLFNEDRSVAVVFNGEIYNYAGLRRDLEQHGHRFRSQSDTEVIVHGYEQWGTACVERFNGMFAFAVWDQARRRLWLVRDRLGIKPLYYYSGPDSLLFASEIKAFVGHPGFTPQVRTDRLGEFLLYRSVADNATLFAGVESVRPGHWLLVDETLGRRQQRYWDVPFGEVGASQDLAERVLTQLQKSVTAQEISDVPIGAQLSGGTDSSLVTALMARGRVTPVKTFAVGFAEKQFSELPYAGEAARHLSTDHHEIEISAGEFNDALEQLTWQQDEPLTHANAAGIYWLCRAAKPLATVLLTGEGADETFAGYYRYEVLRKSFLAHRWLGPIRSVLPRQAGQTRLARLLAAAHGTPTSLIARSSAQGVRTFQDLVDGPEILARRIALLEPAAGQPWLNRALYYDLKTYLPPILMRQDKMSMAWGVETRVPFLDHELVELAFALPVASKLRPGKPKHLLKQIAGRFLPGSLLHRPKVGFGFPLCPWLRDPQGLGHRLDSLTATGSLARQLVPAAVLSKLIEQHRQATADHTEALWTLLSLEIWHQQFICHGH